jgi:hypothetical protein
MNKDTETPAAPPQIDDPELRLRFAILEMASRHTNNPADLLLTAEEIYRWVKGSAPRLPPMEQQYERLANVFRSARLGRNEVCRKRIQEALEDHNEKGTPIDHFINGLL